VERTLRHMLELNGQKSNQTIAQTAKLLGSIAKSSKAPEDWQRRINKMVKKVAISRQTGMTAKNRGRLRALQNEDSLLRLIDLPEQMFARKERISKPYLDALLREDALAIAILSYCPIRVQNLSQIHLQQNLQRPGDGRAYFVFEDDEVKNSRPLEFEVPKDVLKLIDSHLAKRSPWLCPAGTPWLFPKRDGVEPIGASELATRVSKRVLKETGLQVNAHLFRHLAVMIFLDANPGAYEAASRLLGHSSASHTINIYSGMETRSATKAFADLVTAKKGRSR